MNRWGALVEIEDRGGPIPVTGGGQGQKMAYPPLLDSVLEKGGGGWCRKKISLVVRRHYVPR